MSALIFLLALVRFSMDVGTILLAITLITFMAD